VTERSGMICDICALCVRVFVLCVIYVYGPEGDYLVDRKVRAGRQCYVDRKIRAGRRYYVDRKIRAGRQCYVDRTVRAGWRMCVRYIGELTKLRAYVVYVTLFQVLTVTRDGNGSIVHTEERVEFWRILVFFYNGNETTFCNLNVNKILNKCF